MNHDVVQLTLDDFEEAIDLINYVFSQAYDPHDFERRLPKLYRPTEGLMRCVYGIRLRGRLVAVAGAYPLAWQIGATTLRVSGIGGVATHPRHRGSGLMGNVVSHCVAEARAAGCHLSWLDGLRRRYRHFGYERCGTELGFHLADRDFAAAGIDADGLRFRRLREGDALLADAQRLHARQEVHWQRSPAEFLTICTSWNAELYAALDGNEFAGYLIAGRDPSRVVELVAVDAADAARLAAGWCATRGGRIAVAASPWQTVAARSLGALADKSELGCCGNWQVFDWPALLAAVLGERARGGALPSGEVVLEIAGAGRLRLWVDGTAGGCAETGDPPQAVLDPVTAKRALFGPLPAHLAGSAPLPPALESWCPLPLYIPAADRV